MLGVNFGYTPAVPSVAWLSQGKLFVQLADASEPVEIESPYAQSVRVRATKIARRNAWKTQGRGARFMMGLGGAMGEDAVERDPGAIPIHFTGLCRGPRKSQVVYTLSTGAVSGMFAYDVPGREELRLFHGADQVVGDPAYHPDEDVFACTVRGKGAFAHLALMRGDGSELIEITEGESVDGAPSWVPGKRALVYQSCGIGRDQAGNVAGMSPSMIHRLDVEEAEITTLLEGEEFEYSAPRMAEDGTVWAIRRPRFKMKPPPVWRVALDVVLFPFRLLWALVQYLNFFSARYSGKPLLRSGDAKTRRADARRMLVMGNLVDAARETEGDDDDEAPAVPPGCELVKLKPGAKQVEVVARSVAYFDLCPDGTVIHSDGRTITHRVGDETKTLARGKYIHEIVALAEK